MPGGPATHLARIFAMHAQVAARAGCGATDLAQDAADEACYLSYLRALGLGPRFGLELLNRPLIEGCAALARGGPTAGARRRTHLLAVAAWLDGWLGPDVPLTACHDDRPNVGRAGAAELAEDIPAPARAHAGSSASGGGNFSAGPGWQSVC